MSTSPAEPSRQPAPHPLDEFLGTPKRKAPSGNPAPADPRRVTAALLAWAISLAGVGFLAVVWGAISVIVSPYSDAGWVVYLGTALVLAATVLGATGAWRAVRR